MRVEYAQGGAARGTRAYHPSTGGRRLQTCACLPQYFPSFPISRILVQTPASDNIPPNNQNPSIPKSSQSFKSRFRQMHNPKTLRTLLWTLILILGIYNAFATENNAQALQSATARGVYLIQLDRAIDPVSERYLVRELDEAQGEFALVVIVLDTPGGLLDSTRGMVNVILESRTPTAVYVSPAGARAASAGTFIGAAANILAMAPVTEIGAAAVVGGQGEDLGETLQVKANEDAAALLRGIADKRGRNVEALEATVFEAKAYSAEEAVEIGIADIVANDLDALLHWAEGRTVETAAGEIVLEGLLNSRIEESEYSLWDRFLSAIANPNLAFLLISLGGLALVVELWNFGTFIPGTIGVVLLVLGFAGVGQLPFQWAGVLLIALALALLAAEIFVTPGFGFFGIAGVIALILGGLFLFPFPSIDAPELPGGQIQVSRWLLAGIGAVVLAFVLWMIWELRKVSRPDSYIPTGSSSLLVGTTARVTKTLDPEGEVYAAGEHWTAHTPDRSHLNVDTTVKVIEIDGITLVVEPETGENGPSDR